MRWPWTLDSDTADEQRDITDDALSDAALDEDVRGQASEDALQTGDMRCQNSRRRKGMQRTGSQLAPAPAMLPAPSQMDSQMRDARLRGEAAKHGAGWAAERQLPRSLRVRSPSAALMQSGSRIRIALPPRRNSSQRRPELPTQNASGPGSSDRVRSKQARGVKSTVQPQRLPQGRRVLARASLPAGRSGQASGDGKSASLNRLQRRAARCSRSPYPGPATSL